MATLERRLSHLYSLKTHSVLPKASTSIFVNCNEAYIMGYYCVLMAAMCLRELIILSNGQHWSSQLIPNKLFGNQNTSTMETAFLMEDKWRWGAERWWSCVEEGEQQRGRVTWRPGRGAPRQGANNSTGRRWGEAAAGPARSLLLCLQ